MRGGADCAIFEEANSLELFVTKKVCKMPAAASPNLQTSWDTINFLIVSQFFCKFGVMRGGADCAIFEEANSLKLFATKKVCKGGIQSTS